MNPINLSTGIDFSSGKENYLDALTVSSLEIDLAYGTSPLFPESTFSVLDLRNGYYIVTRHRKFALPLDTPMVMTSTKIASLQICVDGTSKRKDLQDYQFEWQQLESETRSGYLYLVIARQSS